jgi:hypothetical protein
MVIKTFPRHTCFTINIAHSTRIAVLQIVDVISTGYALAAPGIVEANPLTSVTRPTTSMNETL